MKLDMKSVHGVEISREMAFDLLNFGIKQSGCVLEAIDGACLAIRDEDIVGRLWGEERGR